MKTLKFVLTGLLSLPLVAVLGAAAKAQPSVNPAEKQAVPAFDLTIRPVREGGIDVASVAVREELRDASHKPVPFSVFAPITYASVTGIADRIQNLEVRDAAGTVPLGIEDDPATAGGMPYFRHWIAKRDVSYPVVITYRALPQTTPAVLGPQFSLRAHSGGISAAGCGFLVVPADDRNFHSQVHWDLSDLAPGSHAATSFGEGPFDFHGPLFALTQGYYLAGPIGRFEKGKDFAGYWLGAPAFDARKEMEWTARCFACQKRFFGETSAPTYRVFLRILPDAPAYLGGTALSNSFLVALGSQPTQTPVAAPRSTIAHEMMHQFIGKSVGPDAGPWYEEGLTEYYTQLLLLRSGLQSIDDYVRSVNNSAGRYYTNPYRNQSLKALSQVGFSSGVGGASAQNVAYTKGRLYFATVDAKIRAASEGRRTLDDVMLPLFKQRSAERTVDVPTLIQAFEKEYGPDARHDFEAVIVRGETLVPPADAFGIGLKRQPKSYQVDGKAVDGFEWVRDPAIPDERLRKN